MILATCNIRSLHTVLELAGSMYSLYQLARNITFVTKIKLTDLVDAEGHVVNHKLISLFDLCPCLLIVRIDFSLQEGNNIIGKETIQRNLCELHLNLKCLDDSNNQHSWKLSGILRKYHVHLEK